jgi:hypothetical protein
MEGAECGTAIHQSGPTIAELTGSPSFGIDLEQNLDKLRGDVKKEMRRHDTYPSTASRGGELAFYTVGVSMCPTRSDVLQF